MKKGLALMLALVMCLAMLPVMAESADYLGDWYLKEMAMGEEVIDPSALGMMMTMTVNSDGTVLMVSSYGEVAEEVKGTWELKDGGLTIKEENGTETLFVLQDGLLVVDSEETGRMTFSREPSEVEPLPNPIPAEKEADFFGTWELTTVAMGGVTMPASLLSLAQTLIVEEGKMTEKETTVDGSELETVYTTTLTDGVLYATSDSGEVILQINDNGTVSMTFEMDEETSIVFYYEAVQ